jgi:CTP synthase (UTP-ammonia lyase)
MMARIQVALIGDYDKTVTAHQAIPRALAAAAAALDAEVTWEWIGTPAVEAETARQLHPYHAVWCVPASPYASMDGALRAIRFAREAPRPFLGTCGGCQHAMIEYARNALGIVEADHRETNPSARLPLISELACALVEKSGSVHLDEGSKIAGICGGTEIEEVYHCRYGLNPQFEHLVCRSDLRISGRDENGEARVFELSTNPFFLCTLFQPERAALTGRNHPLIHAFLAAALDPQSSRA